MRAPGCVWQLPLIVGLVGALDSGRDARVVVTETRTVTECPMTQLNIYEPDFAFAPKTDMSIATAVPTVPYTYPSVIRGGSGRSMTRQWGDWSKDTAETATPPAFGSSATSSGRNRYTTAPYANNTAPSNVVQQPDQTSNSTTSDISCPSWTPSVQVSDAKCNTAKNRRHWCRGKSVDDDTDKIFYTGQVKKFQLTITNTTLNFDGVEVPSFAINGQSPGPLIEANWGDEVEILVTNLLENNATTIHWHGIRQLGTNDMDGVPGISECAIAPGQSFVYRWHASTYGTGWYHSHTLAQFGGGVRGPIVIHGPATADYDLDMGTVMVSDTFEATIFQMAWRTSHTGQVRTVNYLLNGKNVSPDMELGEHQKWVLKPGKKHRLRLINSSAQNAYAIRFDHHKMKVIAADFTPIVPYETEWLFISNGQRYDVIIEADQPFSSYFLRAVTQTGCPSICTNNGLQLANGIIEYEGACNVFPTSDLGNATAADFTDCKGEPLSQLTPWVSKTAGTEADYRSNVRTLPPSSAALTTLGTSGRIVRWFLNGGTMNVTYTQPTLKTLATDSSSLNGTGLSNAIVLASTSPQQWVYFVLQNQFRASHPMHLHGHDFSILGTGKGLFDESHIPLLNFANPIRRDTALLYGTVDAPSGWTVIGFQTDNPGAWLMHCHILWHAEGGMALQFVERPGDIHADTKYWAKPEFQDQCSALERYEAQDAGHIKMEYESGLRMKMLQKRAGARARTNTRVSRRADAVETNPHWTNVDAKLALEANIESHHGTNKWTNL